QFWQDTCEVAPGVSLHRIGGHFPGAAVAHWAEGAEGRGLLLSADTVFPNPDRATVGFMRSYPNNLPLSAQVVRRIADHLAGLRFDAIIGNFATRSPPEPPRQCSARPSGISNGSGET